MHWTIEYYVTSDGKCPVKEFIDRLSPESKAKYVFIADLLENYGLKVREPYVRSILLLPAKSLFCSMDLQKKKRKGLSAGRLQ
jgi:hypothetical protein